MDFKSFHTPVLLEQVIQYLEIKPGGLYIDCTFGFGGHTKAILEKGGKVLSIDSDAESLVRAEKELSDIGHWSLAKKTQKQKPSLVLKNANFSKLEEVARETGFTQVNGILYDLGLSSWQLEHSKRGFTFQKDEPLDMRADQSLGVTAADLVNTLSANELTNLFKKFGEEPGAFRFARSLVRARSVAPITTTFQLLAALRAGAHQKRRGIHPATKVFQALRIAVNSELLSLEESLPQAQKLLKGGGRLLIISFHSLEDRIVKNFGKNNPDLLEIVSGGVIASEKEVLANPRARSARLRVFEKK